ncbi:MAG: cell division protein ZapE [Acetobacteraceae bacterium]|nr:cell division protein ZapE [Acetobacteraceae bacterium]
MLASASTTLGDGPLPAYRAKLSAGELLTDPAQAAAAERLQGLWKRLRGYAPPAPHATPLGLFSRLLHRRPTADDIPADYPHGLYLVGDVGRGKSMLMDLFFAAADVEKKRRIHFNAFMQEAHRRIHAWRRQPERLADPGSDDPIPPLADTIAAEASLLCFDEFQINDIADAMILGRLFKALFARGVVIVATSNTAPDDLFAGQPGRDAFLPFIALIKQYLDVLVMDGSRDFRRQRLLSLPTWHVPADAAAHAALDEAFTRLSARATVKPERLLVAGHTLAVPAAAGGVARFGFDQLCQQALGAGDYGALATHYQALILDDVPRLSPENRDEARRFITLVDELYEHRVKLVASAATVPDQLYEEGEGAAAFRRTASRLVEMQSQEYLALPHLT